MARVIVRDESAMQFRSPVDGNVQKRTRHPLRAKDVVKASDGARDKPPCPSTTSTASLATSDELLLRVESVSAYRDLSLNSFGTSVPLFCQTIRPIHFALFTRRCELKGAIRLWIGRVSISAQSAFGRVAWLPTSSRISSSFSTRSRSRRRTPPAARSMAPAPMAFRGQPRYDGRRKPDDGLVPTYNLAWGLRTVDGIYNHLLPGQEQWGAAGDQFPELVDADLSILPTERCSIPTALARRRRCRQRQLQSVEQS